MDIGKPKRTYRVEPLEDPVPPKRRTRESPQRPPTKAPVTTPAK